MRQALIATCVHARVGKRRETGYTPKRDNREDRAIIPKATHQSQKKKSSRLTQRDSEVHLENVSPLERTINVMNVYPPV